MRFLADTMLGKLATWLRLWGYDTAYLPQADDHALARVARAEDRTLLTRDVELARRRGVRCIWIESEQVEAQLQQLVRELHLDASGAFTRCAECNSLLEELDRPAAQGLVPPYVFQTQQQFRRCPQCGRVYWRGTHWARILAGIEDVNKE